MDSRLASETWSIKDGFSLKALCGTMIISYYLSFNLKKHIKSVHEVKKSNIVDEFIKSDIPTGNANENFNDLIKSDAGVVEKKKINNLSSSEENGEQKEKINLPKCKKKYVKKCSDYNEIWENLI